MLRAVRTVITELVDPLGYGSRTRVLAPEERHVYSPRACETRAP
jgi:hypothetical protein